MDPNLVNKQLVTVYPKFDIRKHPQYERKTYTVYSYTIPKRPPLSLCLQNYSLFECDHLVSSFKIDTPQMNGESTFVLNMNGNPFLRRNIQTASNFSLIQPINLELACFNQMTADIWCTGSSDTLPKLTIYYKLAKQITIEDAIPCDVPIDDLTTLHFTRGICIPRRKIVSPSQVTAFIGEVPLYASESFVIDQIDSKFSAEALLQKYAQHHLKLWMR